MNDINDPQVTVGLIELELALIGTKTASLLPKEDIDYQLRKEGQHIQERDRLTIVLNLDYFIDTRNSGGVTFSSSIRNYFLLDS